MFNQLFSQPRVTEITRSVTPNELRRRVKIVVIDDEEDSFPYRLLQDSGYTIEWWDKVDSNKLQRLENGDFDIIILDIQGVVDSMLSSGDGIEVLKRIKHVNPHQVIVAFSGHSYDLSKTEFWRLADDALNKPVTVIKCKELLDGLIQDKITILNYWTAITELMEKDGVPNRKIKKLEKEILKSLSDKNSVPIDLICTRLFGAIRNISAIVSLSQAIMRIWK
jgi:CheY-like chemotaxis protein